MVPVPDYGEIDGPRPLVRPSAKAVRTHYVDRMSRRQLQDGHGCVGGLTDGEVAVGGDVA